MSNNDTATNGRRAALVGKLEQRVRAAIDAAYRSGRNPSTPATDHPGALRDYVTEISSPDAWLRLVDREAKAEREHRRFTSFAPHIPYAIPVRQGARVTLLHNVGRGAEMADAPPASDFLVYRPSAVEAIVLGWLARRELAADPGLVPALLLLDYAAAVDCEVK